MAISGLFRPGSGSSGSPGVARAVRMRRSRGGQRGAPAGASKDGMNRGLPRSARRTDRARKGTGARTGDAIGQVRSPGALSPIRSSAFCSCLGTPRARPKGPADGARQRPGQGGACLIIGEKLIGDGISSFSGVVTRPRHNGSRCCRSTTPAPASCARRPGSGGSRSDGIGTSRRASSGACRGAAPGGSSFGRGCGSRG
jgi:hypothetical protein